MGLNIKTIFDLAYECLKEKEEADDMVMKGKE